MDTGGENSSGGRNRASPARTATVNVGAGSAIYDTESTSGFGRVHTEDDGHDGFALPWFPVNGRPQYDVIMQQRVDG